MKILLSVTLTYIAGIILLGNIASAQNDPCSDYIFIGNPKRSTMYEYDGRFEEPLCDNVNENAWYNFESITGSEIPEEDSVPILRCGTYAPIFIKKRPGQTYHEEAENSPTFTAQAVTCTNIGGSDSPCDSTNSITIRYCPPVGDSPKFFVYKLKEPDGCDSAYCAGTRPYCRGGLLWNNATARCEQLVPVMTLPTISGPVIVEEEVLACSNVLMQRFAFYCNIGYPVKETDDFSRFVVDLVIDDVVQDVVLPETTGLNPRVEIGEEYLKGRLGKRVACRVISYWYIEDAVERSDPLHSTNSYWARIYAPPVTIDRTTLTATQTMTADVISTVPITCWHCTRLTTSQACQCCRNACMYLFSINAKIDNQKCELEISNSNYVATENQFVAGTLEFSVHQDALLSQNNNFLVNFSMNAGALQCLREELWLGYYIEPMIIQITNNPPSNPLKCSSTGDPHFITIRGIYADNYLIGDFLLARAIDKTRGIYMQIHTRQFTCNGQVACNCGVIVREGNSVIGLDACRSLSTGVRQFKIIRYLRTISEDGSVLSDGATVFMDRTGTQFTILMASGLRVDVTTDGVVMHIYVTFSSIYTIDNIDGMCDWEAPIGNGAQFRLRRDESLFTQNPPECLNWNFQPALECHCQTRNNLTCTTDIPPDRSSVVPPSQSGFSCMYLDSYKKSGQMIYNATYVTGKKSDEFMDLTDVYYDYLYDPDHGKDVNPTWPTQSGKTEQQVEAHCLSVLRSSAVYDKCQGKFNENNIVRDCKQDVQIFDDYEWADNYRVLMENSCIKTAMQESNATNNDELESSPIFTEIVKDVCPSQCNGRGTCQNSTCTCNEGFVGPDCGILKNSPPNLLFIDNNGTCNLTHRECAKVLTYASNIYNSGTTTCRFIAYTLLENRKKISQPQVLLSPGKFLSIDQIECLIPSTKLGMSSGYQLSISNDGVLFSEDLQLIVYDPTCLVHSENIWQQRMNTCYLNEVCYSSGQRQSSTDCLVCTPNGLINEWADIREWGEWSGCSRPCDTGVKSQEFGCTGVAYDVKLKRCNLANCPAASDEFTEGVIFVLRDEDVSQALYKTELLFEKVSDAVNLYCDSHQAQCCTKYEPQPGANLNSMNTDITSKWQVNVGSGFPYPYYDIFRMKLIVTTSQPDLVGLCGPAPKTLRIPNGQIFIDQMVLYHSISASKETIENAIGFKIELIEEP